MAPTALRPTVARASRLWTGAPIGAAIGAMTVTVLLLSDVDVLVALTAAGVGTAVGVAVLMVAARRRHERLIEPMERIIAITHAITDGAVNGRIDLPQRSLLETVRIADAINRLAHRASKDIDELRRLERVRSEFVANVSHELRTPIFSVQGYLETLLDGAMDDPAVARPFLEKAYNNALRLNALLSDLIDISRIESGELKFSFRYFDISELLRDLVNATELRAQQRNVTLACEVPAAAQAYGDKERLTQVITNLIENAIKYNVDGGTVTVSAVEADGGLRVSVRDTGLGIAEEHLPRIFERFYRVDKDRSRAVGGTGLGLAIVKHILEGHRAPITVKSEPGVGTEIAFVLKS